MTPSARSPSPWLLVLLALLLAAGPALAEAPPAEDAFARALRARTNEARAAHGLAPLAADAGLARAAAGHAAELARRGTLDHLSLDPARRTPADRVARAGVALVEVAENLAAIGGPDAAARSVRLWLDSPGHRRNLLGPSYTHVGHAVAEGGGARWIVQVLAARPLARTEASARLTRGDGGGEAVTFEIRYADPAAPLALFVDGVHEPGALVAPGLLRATRPLPREPLRVSVGIDRGDGSARVVERFVLRPGTPPRLVPGEPAEVAAGGAGGGA